MKDMNSIKHLGDPRPTKFQEGTLVEAVKVEIAVIKPRMSHQHLCETVTISYRQLLRWTGKPRLTQSLVLSSPSIFDASPLASSLQAPVCQLCDRIE